jgi:putative ABC transport system permease protein
MRQDLHLAWRSVVTRPVLTLVPALVVALAVGLTIAVLALGDGLRRGIVQASDPFGALVVGPKGDSQQLVLNTLLLQGLPLGTIPYDVYERLAEDTRVRLAVPLATGDNLGGAPIIGTSAAFFELRPSLNEPPSYQIADGRLFEQEFEAVLGSRAAQDTGLRVGDSFRGAHGFEPGLEDDVHEQVYTVVGVLRPSGTSYDNAVLTTAASVWHVHEEHEDEETAAEEPGHDEEHGDLTAILVLPVGFAEQNQIWQEFYAGTEAQAVFPGSELGGLFDLVRQGERVLTWVGYLILAIAAATIFLSVYSSTVNRERDLAVLRSLGASRLNIFRIVLFEALLLSGIGVLLGHVLGYVAAALIGEAVSQQFAIPLLMRLQTELILPLILLTLGAGIVAGLLPAVLAYRVDVVDKLSAV